MGASLIEDGQVGPDKALGSPSESMATILPRAMVKPVSVWGSETPIICLTCGFATRRETSERSFECPGSRQSAFDAQLPFGTKPWVHAEPFRAGVESVGLRSHPLRLGGQLPEAGPREA